jgi:hypothetical protein
VRASIGDALRPSTARTKASIRTRSPTSGGARYSGTKSAPEAEAQHGNTQSLASGHHRHLLGVGHRRRSGDTAAVTNPDEHPLPPPPYSEESAAQLVRIGGNLIAALEDYLVAAAAVRSKDDDASTDDAYARVVQAMAVFDAAHLDHLDYSAPAGDVDDLEFDEELDSDVEDTASLEDDGAGPR